MIFMKDMYRSMDRFDVPFRMNDRHPINTLKAQRLLCAISDENIRFDIARMLFSGTTVIENGAYEFGSILVVESRCFGHETVA